jgi:magnesium-transporting ATPase (P-type)
MLDDLNVPQARVENREYLAKIGGHENLKTLLGINTEIGLTHEQVERQRATFGENQFPESPMDSFLSLLFAAFQDTTLLILLAAAAVSLIIGGVEDPAGGWIEGVAIFIAVFLVANISAGNDYTKQLQFKALEASSAADERTSVLRNGTVERINPIEIVVGDVIVLQVRSYSHTLDTLFYSQLLLSKPSYFSAP